MSIVFALHGAKGAGKDEFCKIVKRFFPDLDVRKISYADPIRRKVNRIFDLRSEEEYDLFKRTTLSFNIDGEERRVDGRTVVRDFGMLMRSYDVDQFVRNVEQEIEASPDTVWCITDLRFQNELDSVRALDAVVVKVLRAGVTYDGHVTEIEIPDALCDYIVHNDGTMLNYEFEVVSLVEHVIHYRAPELLKVEG